jgi:hypothetical protein
MLPECNLLLNFLMNQFFPLNTVVPKCLNFFHIFKGSVSYLDNIKVDLQEMRFDDVHLIYMTQDRVWWCALSRTVLNHLPLQNI